jgi:dipeptidyl aminopeptidase/acylaminoacyl peptidase
VIYFRYTGLDPHYGKLARVRLAGNAKPEFFDAFDCEVVHVAGHRGLCLSARRGVITTYTAKIFDTRDLKVLAELPLAGVPSRCRVSRDGRRAALTVFVSGHAYAAVNFSTQTLLIDLATGTVEADLEKFAVSKGGAPIQASDFNFWGVTFAADSRYFYATLSTGGEHYLIEGDAKTRSAKVIRKGMECPSLSPDGRRIAFKKRFTDDGRVQWHIAVFDLANGRETVLAETRSVDDQLEWLDDERVLYSMPAVDGGSGASTDVWVTRADGSSQPERFLGNAYSPAVLR